MVFLNLLLFIVILGGIILIHEFGHYYFARRAGILVHEFAIGMGPILLSKRNEDHILYAIRAIPIGGYVSMAGEEVSDALIKKGQTIGLTLEGDVVTRIHTLDADAHDVFGTVVAYDLYGKDQKELFVTLDTDKGTQTFQVSRTCFYMLKKDRYMLVTPEEGSFESKTLWQRFLVIFAGPLMNFILALALYLIVALFVTAPNLSSNTIGAVVEGYPAATLGLVEGDTITAINGSPIDSWTDLSAITATLQSSVADIEVLKVNGDIETFNQVPLVVVIQTAGFTNVNDQGEIIDGIGQTFGRALEAGLQPSDVIYELSQGTITQPIEGFDDIIHFFQTVTSGDVTVKYYEAGSSQQTLTYTILSNTALERLGYDAMTFQLGISSERETDILYSLTYPFKMIGQNVRQVFNTLGLLFSPNENVGLSDLSGPVGIFSLVSQTSSQGLLAILAFTAFLSINIGILNLLPIPALDGGRLVFLGYEWITKKTLSKKVENSINMTMFYLLMGLFVYVTYHDILRLIRGLI